VVARALLRRLVIVQHGQPEPGAQEFVGGEPVAVVARTGRSRVGRPQVSFDKQVPTGSERLDQVGEPVERVEKAHRDQLVRLIREAVRRGVGLNRFDPISDIALGGAFADDGEPSREASRASTA